MSTRRAITWTCDRCNLTEERGMDAPVGDCPLGWLGVQTFDPPQSSSDADGTSERKHLCRACAGDLGRFLSLRVRDVAAS